MTHSKQTLINHRESESKAGRKRRELSANDEEWKKVKSYLKKLRNA